MSAVVSPPPISGSPERVRTPGAFGAVYKLFLRNQVTVGRVAAVVALGVVGILLGVAEGSNHSFYPIEGGALLINRWTLVVMAPVISLVFASSAIGDLVDDKTLVYLWLRPVNRMLVASAAATASLTVCLPAVLVPTVLMAAATGGGGALIAGAAISAAIAVVAYVGMFLALGLRFRRALVWGLVYILLWEGFVAGASKTATRLAIRGYTQSILSQYTGVGFKHASLSLAPAIIVPILVGIVFVALCGIRLAHTPVD